MNVKETEMTDVRIGGIERIESKKSLSQDDASFVIAT
jgi:hypothetical protein